MCICVYIYIYVYDTAKSEVTNGAFRMDSILNKVHDLYWDFVWVIVGSKKMETTTVYWRYIGITLGLY